MSVKIAFNSSDSITLQCSKDVIIRLVEQVSSLFYILSPYDHIYNDSNEVPNYEVALIPAIGLLLIIEQLVRFIQRKDLTRFQDIVINIGASLIFTITRVFLLSVLIIIFTWIYDNYRIVDLPLHSVWTWIFSLLLVEFFYYWTHRALHELNILWAAHQFHHMAEDLNIVATIRDSIVDLIIYDIFPIPLAVIIPPPILVVHIQFSLLYQVWLHNDVVGNLGFIEYIINTPRQHRVHHGKNPYCIDKNFGALIMIWDRIFGTHQTYQQKVVYGVVSPTPQTFDSMTLQFGYYRDVWIKFKTAEGFGNKMSALFKGPGWAPGKPRLGLISDVPEPDLNAPKYSYDPYIPLWKKIYVYVHGIIITLGFFFIADHPYIRFSPFKGLLVMFYIILFLTSFGAIFDNRKFAPLLEIIRCFIYFPFDYYIISSVDWYIGPNETLMQWSSVWSVRLIHVLSIIFWISYYITIAYIRKTQNNSDYVINNYDEKDIESDTSSKIRNTKCKGYFTVLGFVFTLIIFFIAWTTRIESCTLMLNRW